MSSVNDLTVEGVRGRGFLAPLSRFINEFGAICIFICIVFAFVQTGVTIMVVPNLRLQLIVLYFSFNVF